MNPQNLPTSSESAGESDSGARGTDVKGTLVEAKTKLTQTARETAVRAKDEAERVVTEKKATAANRIGDYSSAIHDSARSLEQKDPNIAWFTHQAADKLQSVADYMRNRDFSNLRQDAEGVARRHPAAFFGGMFVAGLILGNIVKASRRNVDDDSDFNDGTDDDSPGESAEMSDTAQAELTQAERPAAGI